MNKLDKGDEDYLTYSNGRFKYRVTETKIISPEDIGYLDKKTDKKTVTLMTCWPAGTSLKRLLVIGELT